MRLFLKVISYIFHPLLVPFAGTLLYFLITPKYSPLELQSGNILPIFILTVIIPIIFFLILKNLGIVSSFFLPTTKERKYPLYISICLLLMVVLKVIPNNYVIELHFYFIGLITAALTALILLFFNFNSSFHLIGLGSLLVFLINLSIHFEKNITIAVGLITLVTGIVASSRLLLKTHNKVEILIGLFIGAISQLLTLQFWL